jgi:hypothetical protein
MASAALRTFFPVSLSILSTGGVVAVQQTMTSERLDHPEFLSSPDNGELISLSFSRPVWTQRVYTYQHLLRKQWVKPT